VELKSLKRTGKLRLPHGTRTTESRRAGRGCFLQFQDKSLGKEPQYIVTHRSDPLAVSVGALLQLVQLALLNPRELSIMLLIDKRDSPLILFQQFKLPTGDLY